MPAPPQFELAPRAVDRVIDKAFPVYRARIEEAGDGFDARSLVSGWVGDDQAEARELGWIVSCIAYHAFIDDEVLLRPPGFQFSKALLAIVAGGWWRPEPGVAMCLRHESDTGIQYLGEPRDALEVFPEWDVARWDHSYEGLAASLQTLVDMGNELRAHVEPTLGPKR